MTSKDIFKKISNDISNSDAKIINNNDNLSYIKENVNNKYTEDISDSDDELSSYRNRNNKLINKLTKKNKVVDDKNIGSTKKELINKSKNNEKLENKEYDKIVNKIKKSQNDDDIESEVQSETEENDESDEEYEYTEEFAEKVRNYVQIDDQIRKNDEKKKELNKDKKNAEKEILKHLERLGENVINITGGKLRINQYETKSSLKEDIVKKVLNDKIKDPKIVETILENIDQERENAKKIQKSLKRTYERNKKDK
jgi:hypothetical protein